MDAPNVAPGAGEVLPARGTRIEVPGQSARVALRKRGCITTSIRMGSRERWTKFLDNPLVEWSIFLVGVILLTVSPLVGAIPGPGGIIVAGLGLAMVLKTSMWAKRHYVRVKRWQPKAGRWLDWALRRASAQRREAIRKAQETSGGN